MCLEPVEPTDANRITVGSALRQVIAAAILGLVSVAFTISFAALVYAGPLAPLLGQGIGLALASGVVLSVVGILTHSFRGTVCAPQDTTAILLAPAAVAISAGLGRGEEDMLLPTVAMLCAVSMLASGVLCLVLGSLRFGLMARYIPYPVIGGFLAATGYLLVMGALVIATGETIDLGRIPSLIEGDAPLRWGPWLLGGLVMTFTLRLSTSNMALPLCLVIAAVGFYGTLHLLGIPMAQMRADGYMLGPFEDGGRFLDGPVAFYSGSIAWGEVTKQAPTIIAVAGMTFLAALLKSTGLEYSVPCEVDFDRDLRGAGWSNLLAAPTGGLPGHLVLLNTVIANRLGLAGAYPGLVTAAAAGATLMFGPEILSFVPAGLIAMLIAYLGFDMLLTWLVIERRRLRGHDYAVVLAIVGVAATIGILEALVVGLLAAVATFVVSYSRTDFVRVRSTAASRRSRVERPEEDERCLSQYGHHAVILELGGYLFFGTARRLLDRVRAELAANPRPEHLVLDMSRVSGIAPSAMLSLGKVVALCRTGGATSAYSGLGTELRGAFDRTIPDEMPDSMPPSVDAALEQIETVMLGRREATARGHLELLSLCEELERSTTAQSAVRRLEVGAGENVIRQGGDSQEVFVLVSGTVDAEVDTAYGDRRRVARFQPGALIGEIAYYAATPRTASVVARTETILVCVDLDRLEACDWMAAARFHRQAARSMALRVGRMTRLFSDAEL